MVASSKLPLIISIGIGFPMEKLYIIKEITDKYGNDLTLLHCNNAYPTPYEDVNLNSMLYLKKFFNSVGLSDHTTSTFVPSLAVAMGASTIEKHFTLDKKLKGPDHSFALEPNELNTMVDMIRKTELCLKIKENKLTKSEKLFDNARRSIVANKEIKEGEEFTIDNITTKRPYILNKSILAENFFNVIGKRATQNYLEDDMI